MPLKKHTPAGKEKRPLTLPERNKPFLYKELKFRPQYSGRPQKNGYLYLELQFLHYGAPVCRINIRGKDSDTLAVNLEAGKERLYRKALKYLRSREALQNKGISIGLLWEIWKEDLARANGWNPSTLADKDRIIGKLLPLLPDKPVAELTVEDYLKAAEQAEKSKIPPKIRRMECLKLLGKLTNLSAFLNICAVDVLEKYLEIARPERRTERYLKDNFRANSLSRPEEKALWKHVEDNPGAPLSIGLALGLLAGLSVGEICALKAAHIHRSQQFENLMTIFVRAVCTEQKSEKGKKKSNKKLVDSELLPSLGRYRAIPVHPRLRAIVERRLAQMGDAVEGYVVSNAINGSVQMAPSVLRKAFLSLFAKADMPGSVVIQTEDGGSEICPDAAILERNFAYRLEQECCVSEDELRYLTGKVLQSVDAVSYRDWLIDDNQLLLLTKLSRWQPGMNEESDTVVHAGKDITINVENGIALLLIRPGNNQRIQVEIQADGGLTGIMR